jgi:hypothetical protein
MNEDRFKNWLLKNKQLGAKQSGDVLSRCRRIERVLNVSLDGTVSSQSKLDALMERLWSEAAEYLRPGANRTTAASQLRSAARLYAEYKSSNK